MNTALRTCHDRQIICGVIKIVEKKKMWENYKQKDSQSLLVNTHASSTENSLTKAEPMVPHCIKHCQTVKLVHFLSQFFLNVGKARKKNLWGKNCGKLWYKKTSLLFLLIFFFLYTTIKF